MTLAALSVINPSTDATTPSAKVDAAPASPSASTASMTASASITASPMSAPSMSPVTPVCTAPTTLSPTTAFASSDAPLTPFPALSAPAPFSAPFPPASAPDLLTFVADDAAHDPLGLRPRVPRVVGVVVVTVVTVVRAAFLLSPAEETREDAADRADRAIFTITSPLRLSPRNARPSRQKEEQRRRRRRRERDHLPPRQRPDPLREAHAVAAREPLPPRAGDGDQPEREHRVPLRVLVDRHELARADDAGEDAEVRELPERQAQRG
eukprot:30805-Pelagococcus_subviridis.AAC.5